MPHVFAFRCACTVVNRRYALPCLHTLLCLHALLHVHRCGQEVRTAVFACIVVLACVVALACVAARAQVWAGVLPCGPNGIPLQGTFKYNTSVEYQDQVGEVRCASCVLLRAACLAVPWQMASSPECQDQVGEGCYMLRAACLSSMANLIHASYACVREEGACV